MAHVEDFASMDEIARPFLDEGVGSIFVYTHEAHPDEHYPHLTSMEQECRHARDLRDILGVGRLILVDSLAGACHRAPRSLPNMSWVFTDSGVPGYESDWTDAHSVANTIEHLLDVSGRRQAKELLARSPSG